jgi:hypothetical protein
MTQTPPLKTEVGRPISVIAKPTFHFAVPRLRGKDAALALGRFRPSKLRMGSLLESIGNKPS